jgi:hypothetical protein
MGRVLRYTGMSLLAAAACLAVAGEAGWVPTRVVHDGLGILWKAGLLSLGAGVLLAFLTPIGREIRRGHCVRCGAAIERGQTYCRDHLQEAVNEYRDRTRGA